MFVSLCNTNRVLACQAKFVMCGETRCWICLRGVLGIPPVVSLLYPVDYFSRGRAGRRGENLSYGGGGNIRTHQCFCCLNTRYTLISPRTRVSALFGILFTISTGSSIFLFRTCRVRGSSERVRDQIRADRGRGGIALGSYFIPVDANNTKHPSFSRGCVRHRRPGKDLGWGSPYRGAPQADSCLSPEGPWGMRVWQRLPSHWAWDNLPAAAPLSLQP